MCAISCSHFNIIITNVNIRTKIVCWWQVQMILIHHEVAHTCKKWVLNRMKVLKAYSGVQVVSFLPLPSFCPSSPPFLPPSFLPSVRVCPLPPSFFIPLASWRSCPIWFIPGLLSFNNGHNKLIYLSGWSETQCLTTASTPSKVFKQCGNLLCL